MRLGSFPFRMWDESMFAVNAYEMVENGNLFVPYFDGAIDVRNSKPLLLVWLQALFIKGFGFNELMVRLPAAIACFLTIFAVFNFLRKEVGTYFGWTASLILLTSLGFVTFHTGRTGDADSLLTLFTTLSIINILKWGIHRELKYIFYSIIFLNLGFLSKSFAALIFLAPMLIFMLHKGKEDILTYLKSTYLLKTIGVFIATVSIGFLIREIYQPGYLNYIFSHDAGRLFHVVETHAHPWYFYIFTLMEERYLYWFSLFLIGVFLNFTLEKGPLKTIATGSLIFIGFYFIVISLSTTKLVWYDLPLYPLLAIVSAIPIYKLIAFFKKSRDQQKWLAPTFFLLTFIVPYSNSFAASRSNSIINKDYELEINHFYLKDQLSDKKSLPNLTVFHNGYRGSLLCYKYRYKERNSLLKITQSPIFKPKELVLVARDSMRQILNSKYDADTVEIYDNAVLYQINDDKQQTNE